MNAPFVASSIAISRATPPDRAEIADFVRELRGSPFHLLEWSESVAAGCGQQDRYLVARDGGRKLVGVLPLTLVSSSLFGRALASAGFAVDGGILATVGSAGQLLADEAWSIAQREGATTLELRGGEAPDSAFHSDNASYLGFVRDLAADDEAELLAIPRKQRAEVRKALGNELVAEVGTGARDRTAHFTVYAESVRNLGTPVFPRRLFAEVLDRMDADILTVRHQGRAVASVLSLYWQGTVYPYWGGGTAEARGLRANDMMYFALMRHARGRGCTRFDFGRSKVGIGAAAFKKNWGFEGTPLAYHVRTADGAAPRSVNPLDPKYARKIALWKRLPLPIANLIGPYIARGLG